MASQPTNNFDFQNFYGSTLSSDITSGTLTIPLATVPTPSEGILIISPDSANPECIYYTSKGASTVTAASDGRGWDSSTATAWTQGTTVIMAPTAYMLRMLKQGSLFDTTLTGWTSLGIIPTFSSDAGQRSYVLSTASDKSGVLSPGMRLKFDRSTVAPNQCTNLNGTTQYFSKASPAGMSATDNISVIGWLKPNAYTQGGIASRNNGTTDGWKCFMNASGQIVIQGARAADDVVTTNQSVPLNKWTHIAITINSAGTAGTAYFDGTSIPITFTNNANSGFLAPTQSFLLGATNGAAATDFFPGKLAQVAIFSSVLTQANVRAYRNQTLVGNETNIISHYSLSNTLNDSSTNANNLTAQGSATTTTADSPFAQGATGGVTEFGIVTACDASTITIQVAEGSVVPSSGTMTNFYYSLGRSPYKFPSQQTKWEILTIQLIDETVSITSTNQWFPTLGGKITVPIGEWLVGYQLSVQASSGSNAAIDLATLLSSSVPTNNVYNQDLTSYVALNATTLGYNHMVKKDVFVSLAAQATYTQYAQTSTIGAAATWKIRGTQAMAIFYARNAYL